METNLQEVGPSHLGQTGGPRISPPDSAGPTSIAQSQSNANMPIRREGASLLTAMGIPHNHGEVLRQVGRCQQISNIKSGFKIKATKTMALVY